jgi:hypothetical protein
VSRHVVFNENHFPFQEGFLDTRNPIKIVTNDTPIRFPSFPAGITTNNTVEATNNTADQQEPELNNINTTAVESDTSEHTDENNLSNGEIEDSTEAVGGESMQEITQPSS